MFILGSCGGNNEAIDDILAESEDVPQTTSLWFEWVGTSPLWAFRYTGGMLNWQEPGMKGSDSYSASGSASEVEGTQNISIVAGDFSAVLTQESCEDGQSENEYEYTVLVKKDTREFTGCAREYIK